ncbi:MAG: pitrilysin family protein [Vicinamibacterales bacterium]|nr:pitrilysin family protein [Vicinamibacterales bacterium]
MTTASVTGLSPVRERLVNGVTLLVEETRAQPAVTIGATMSAGSLCDPSGAEGTAQLLSRLLDRGAGERTADEVADLLDLGGVSPAVSVTRHATTVTCDCLAEDVETVLEIVCDMLRAPGCPDVEIATRRGQLLTELRQDEDSPATRALEAAMTLLYGETHPYGRRPKGSAATVEAIDRRQLLDFHAAHFAPGRLTLVLVGDIDVSAAVAMVTRVCVEWASRGAPSSPLPPPRAQTRQRLVISMPGKAQADVVYGFTTIQRSDPAFYAYWVMNNVLGQYGIGGRLGRNIRERQGMAYYAGSMFEASHIAGPLLVRAGVSADNVDRAIAAIDSEVEELARDGVTDEELENAKRYLSGSIPRSLETNAGIARFLQTTEQFDLGLDYDRRLPGLIEAVTADAVAEAARQTLVTDRAAIVIAGPYEDS